MPCDNLTLYAKCIRDNPETYYIIVEKEGQGTVTDSFGNIVDEKKMQDGESIVLNATPAKGYDFDGWMYKGKIISTDLKQKFTIDGESITVTACFSEEKLGGRGEGDSLKIISVRDLRWKDYFVHSKSQALTGNVFKIPQSGTMLKSVNNYPEVLKMGYAVEFELTTSQLRPDRTVVVINPSIWDGSNKVDWDKVEDDVAKEYISNGFKQIIIYSDNSPAYVKEIDGKSSINLKTKFQTSATKVEPAYYNNGVDINKMKWNWLYYLPGEISFPKYYTNGENITIKFDIQIHEIPIGKKLSDYDNTTLVENLVLFEQKFSGVQWDGEVYKYSKKQSLFDDIYDNAQN